MDKEVEYKLTWYSAEEIKLEHQSIPITQVSCWVFTFDNKLILVSKDAEKWSITAGHIEDRDSGLKAAAIREVAEEAGLDISSYSENIKMVGYYLVDTIDKSSRKVIDKNIQARFFVKINKRSKELNLRPNEREDKIEKVKYAKPFAIAEALEKVKWMGKSGDFIEINKLLKLD